LICPSPVVFADKQQIHLVRHLGHGKLADCCSGVTKNGKQSCAIKLFFVSQESETRLAEWAQKELLNRKTIYEEIVTFQSVTLVFFQILMDIFVSPISNQSGTANDGPN
jgi:hypothetical protein